MGRYTFDTTNGTPTKQQDADNYTQVIKIESYYQELTRNSGNTAAKDLGNFIEKTKANGGYYLARYEASGGVGDNTTSKVKSQYDKVVWSEITQSKAAANCQSMYQGNNFVESDLINSYVWDTAIVFIQKYSENSNYANETSSIGELNTGISGDKVCNIYDMASNCFEWSTEYSNAVDSDGKKPLVYRGGNGVNPSHKNYPSSRRGCYVQSFTAEYITFRPICYLK